MTTLYVDPTYVGGSNDGSFAHPYTSFTSTPTMVAGNSYLLKEGTTFVGTINPGATTGTVTQPIIIGVYAAATGNRITNKIGAAAINATGVSYGVFITSSCAYITLDGFEIYGATLRCVAKATVSSSPSEASFCTFSNLHIRNSISIGMVVQGKGNKITTSNIYDCADDNVQCNADDLEVSYCNFRRPNFFAADLDGDNLQITTGERYNVHHNFFDNRINTYKQCFIDKTSGAVSPSRFCDNYCLADTVNTGTGINYMVIIFAPGSEISRNTIIGGLTGLQVNGVGSQVSSNFIDVRGLNALSGIQIRNDNIDVYNNTILGNSLLSNSTGISHSSAGDTGCSAKNNVLVGWKTGVTTVGGVVTVVKNAFLNCTADAAGTNTNPVSLVDADLNELYHPASSTLSSAGIFVKYGMDRNGKQFYNPPCIGAYEVIRSRAPRI